MGSLSLEGDGWLFEADASMSNVRDELGIQMAGLTDSLGELRQTLSLILGETPFPVEATTHAPCAIFHHDDVLFDGEVNLPQIVAQEDIVGGEASFLFGDNPAINHDITQQAA